MQKNSRPMDHGQSQGFITGNFGKDAKLRLSRSQDSSGFDVYQLENLARKERLIIPRFLFEFLRSKALETIDLLKKEQFEELQVEFKGVTKFRFYHERSSILLKSIDSKEGAQGALTLSVAGLVGMVQLMFDQKLEHGNDVLKRIIAYHRLFKFTFVEGSESLNSSLALRSDVLSQLEDYVPPVGRRANARFIDKGRLLNLEEATLKDPQSNKLAGKKSSQDFEVKNVFKSRLAERDGGKAWKVDYQALFGSSGQALADKQPKVNSGEENQSSESKQKHAWLIPLLSQDLKTTPHHSWRCELSIEESSSMRENFLAKKNDEFFLGFDICDAIYRTSSGKLKTFRFPIYYMQVEVSQSGRTLVMTSVDDKRIFLNHVGLAMLVQTFSDEANPNSGLEKFFNSLHNQRLEFDDRSGRVYLSRKLPCSDHVFEKTRDILLGLPGENGKGGLFSDLNILGIECDVDAIYLYRASSDHAPLQRALELDLKSMQDLADRASERFLKTIPGRILGGVKSYDASKQKNFADTVYAPQYLAPSTRRLVQKLNQSNVVLLEGPPGTGKTHTIMNLLVHGICSGQKILIVSDQSAALHALVEKVEAYLRKMSHGGLADHSLDLFRRSVKLVDSIEGGQSSLGVFCRTLEESLGLTSAQDQASFVSLSKLISRQIGNIDKQISNLKSVIQQIMKQKLSSQSAIESRVSPKSAHETTDKDINTLIEFLKFLDAGSTSKSDLTKAKKLIRTFMLDREYLASAKDFGLYDWFELPSSVTQEHFDRLDQNLGLVVRLLRLKPKSARDLIELLGNNKSPNGRMTKHFVQLWRSMFPADESGFKQSVRTVKAFFSHPAKDHLERIFKILNHQKLLFGLFSKIPEGVWSQLQKIHKGLHPNLESSIPLAVEICRYSIFEVDAKRSKSISIQKLLSNIDSLDQERAQLVHRLLINKLEEIDHRANDSSKGSSSLFNRVAGLVSSLRSNESLEDGYGVWRELQESILDAYPIWLCRKQSVSFLFPCREKLFDLVIVDEATQCRVDDALPLMLRAKKVMVVGDDKQTVLAKDSVIDDYLFKEFNLDEYLRSTQAKGIKGGGSHIFGLVKGIKEASVMLDEHYRCPPDIIDYSNRYVYGSQLRVMKWRKSKMPKSVYIDWSEKNATSSQRLDSGAFKGIEVDMVDRFLKYVTKSIFEIEKETGSRINVETDVALCYFLLKNEPYIKSKKAKFLEDLNRGEEILDGAGAALQGKERPYIFYFWDISRSNVMAFRQGDDPDKRKGELNVLMSRPQKRAYHFLHKSFDQLDHDKASITDYLWNAYRQQSEGEAKVRFTKRSEMPSKHFSPWKRSSGDLIRSIIFKQLQTMNSKPINKEQTQTGIIVGDPRFKVDFALHKSGTSIGVVDLSVFTWHAQCSEDVVDYFFQLKRSDPQIDPVFVWLHELANTQSDAFERLVRKTEV